MPIYENTAAWISRGELWQDNRVLGLSGWNCEDDPIGKDFSDCPLMRFDQEDGVKYEEEIYGDLIGNEHHVDATFEYDDELPHVFIRRPIEYSFQL